MNRTARIVIIVLVIAAALAITTSASTGIVPRELHYNDIKITFDGNEVLPKDAAGNYIEPFIIDGTTYLPVRGIASALGLEVGWDQATKTVLLSTTKSPAPAEQPTPTENTIGSSQTIENITITLTDVRRSAGGAFFVPDEGTEFLIFELDVYNNTGSSIDISALVSFTAYIDGYIAQ